MEHWNVWRQNPKVCKISFSVLKVGKKFLEIKKPSKRSNVPFENQNKQFKKLDMEGWNVWRQNLKVYKFSFSVLKVGKKFLEI